MHQMEEQNRPLWNTFLHKTFITLVIVLRLESGAVAASLAVMCLLEQLGSVSPLP